MTIAHGFEGSTWGFTFVIKWQHYSWKYNNWNDQLTNNKLGTEKEDSYHTKDTLVENIQRKAWREKGAENVKEKQVCLIGIIKREERKKGTNNICRDNA